MEEIGGLSDAIAHWKSKKGGTVLADDILIEEIKSSLSEVFEKLENIVVGKIENAKENETYHIESAPGSRRAGWCLTLGWFSVNIEYDYDFEPNQKTHYIKFHFWGYDTWDFEFKKCEWYDVPTHLHNIFEEFFPSLYAGDGKPFDIEYDFYVTLRVETQ